MDHCSTLAALFSKSLPDAETGPMNGAASIRATQAYRAGGALTYGPFDAVPDRKEFLSVRSQNFHRLGLQTYTKPYTVFALRKIMLYFTNTYCSLVPLKIP
jgi:hypothetical protein